MALNEASDGWLKLGDIYRNSDMNDPRNGPRVLPKRHKGCSRRDEENDPGQNSGLLLIGLAGNGRRLGNL